MGHRALIAETQPDDSIKFYYTQWGASNAHNAADDEKPEVPEKAENEEIKTAKNLKRFVLEEVDSVMHEAVWIDGDCYYTLDHGQILKCDTGKEFRARNPVNPVPDELKGKVYELIEFEPETFSCPVCHYTRSGKEARKLEVRVKELHIQHNDEREGEEQ